MVWNENRIGKVKGSDINKTVPPIPVKRGLFARTVKPKYLRKPKLKKHKIYRYLTYVLCSVSKFCLLCCFSVYYINVIFYLQYFSFYYYAILFE